MIIISEKILDTKFSFDRNQNMAYYIYTARHSGASKRLTSNAEYTIGNILYDVTFSFLAASKLHHHIRPYKYRRPWSNFSNFLIFILVFFSSKILSQVMQKVCHGQSMWLGEGLRSKFCFSQSFHCSYVQNS